MENRKQMFDDEIDADDRGFVRSMQQMSPSATKINANELFFKAGFAAGAQSTRQPVSHWQRTVAAVLIGMISVPAAYWSGKTAALAPDERDIIVANGPRDVASKEFNLPQPDPFVTARAVQSERKRTPIQPHDRLTAFHGNVDWRMNPDRILSEIAPLQPSLTEPGPSGPSQPRLYAGDLTAISELTAR
ncbi:hypothetical protein [Novipirellula artificiosorum]|nr:hypothetical protein [Novipirellula artificiosorum]